jgi:16S rRNA C1402 N4-methylase RsmH
VDATLGAGGHAEALLERGPQIRLLGLNNARDGVD